VQPEKPPPPPKEPEPEHKNAVGPPPPGWEQVDVLIDDFILRIHLFKDHSIKELIAYVKKVLPTVGDYKDGVEIMGVTSPEIWEEDHLMFCDEDVISELEGWDEAQEKKEHGNFKFICATQKKPMQDWNPVSPEDEKNFKVVELHDYKWGPEPKKE